MRPVDVQLSDSRPAPAARHSKPPILLKWAGSKTALSPEILSHISRIGFRRYFEPFLGSGAIFFRLAPALAVIGDANPHLMKLYSVVKRNPAQLAEQLEIITRRAEKLEGSAFIDFYYHMRDEFPHKSAAANSALLIFLNRHCWNGLYRENASGRFNTPIGSRHSLQELPTLEQLGTLSGLLQNAALRLDDFEHVIALARAGDFVYLDPPYIPISATARFTSYNQRDFNWQDQVRLKKTLFSLNERGISFLLSNSGSKGVAAFYSEFNVKLIEVNRSINSIGSRRTGHHEILVANFPL